MKKGILLVNLGSPDSPAPKDVKRYLGEFLMDERVIDIPYLLRALLVKGIILNTRPKKSARAYQKVWLPEGSPLIVLSNKLLEKVQPLVDAPVEMAMRYGNPSLESGFEKLQAQGVTDVLLVPLYPQHAMATTETIVVLAEELIKKRFTGMKMETVPAFYNRPSYIQTLSASIQESMDAFQPDYLLFSYHGVPERHIRKTDCTGEHCKINDTCCITPSAAHAVCYRHQCHETTRQVAETLGLKEGEYGTSFQSRLGRDPWLKPYTDATLVALGEKGIKKLAVATPAFVADCLETIEEIGMEGAHEFKEAGGSEFLTIPCLNDRDDWAQTLSSWIGDYLHKA